MTGQHRPFRILIAGGGTGGHLFPGIAIAESFLASRPCDIRFAGTNRGIEKEILPRLGYPLYTLPVSGLYRVGLLRQVKSLAKLPLACLKSLWILLTYRPHLVVGIGGYASGPVLAIALLLRKRTIIQEQNAFPGITNRVLGRFVPLTFVPFTGMESLFRKTVVVGNPIRQSIRNAAGKTDLRDGKPSVISVLGGSQGAHILNRTVVAMLPMLAKWSPPPKIIHQTGRADFEFVREAYRLVPTIQADVQPFFDDIERVYLDSRLIICRAGSIVNEIIAIGRASVLVPIVKSSGDHQRENAVKLVSAGAALMIEEKALEAESLLRSVRILLSAPDRIEAMEKAARSLYAGDSAALIVRQTMDYYRL
jgi:UDP-N-acetylglucosamine--N-acetylmuramyl-(pentapeptide) pyrophosphoryl-undecaprenol N-acetylglucosamine transferase